MSYKPQGSPTHSPYKPQGSRTHSPYKPQGSPYTPTSQSPHQGTLNPDVHTPLTNINIHVPSTGVTANNNHNPRTSALSIVAVVLILACVTCSFLGAFLPQKLFENYWDSASVNFINTTFGCISTQYSIGFACALGAGVFAIVAGCVKMTGTVKYAAPIGALTCVLLGVAIFCSQSVSGKCNGVLDDSTIGGGGICLIVALNAMALAVIIFCLDTPAAIIQPR